MLSFVFGVSDKQYIGENGVNSSAGSDRDLLRVRKVVTCEDCLLSFVLPGFFSVACLSPLGSINAGVFLREFLVFLSVLPGCIFFRCTTV